MTTHEDAAPPTVAVLVGSVRQPRVGRSIADWFVAHGSRRTDLDLDLVDLAEVALPFADTPPGGNSASPISARLAADATLSELAWWAEALRTARRVRP
ncbi:NAD(P)H-dependent oxidoreductase [Micromonospora sp. NPDC049645]|uniref:NAD(P)H-dependent oxidoreductase n=1 Tax=Micromonospora sp. NPDC049645 TaxID=3155508 RepID=UPI0034374920